MINHWELELQETIPATIFRCNGEQRYIKSYSFAQVKYGCYWMAICPHPRPWAFFGTGTCTDWEEGTFLSIIDEGPEPETTLPMVQIGDRITVTGLLEFDGEITAPMSDEQQLQIMKRVGRENKEE